MGSTHLDAFFEERGCIFISRHAEDTNMKLMIRALLAVFAGMLLYSPAQAQRGTGQPDGVARQGSRPEVQTFTGSLKEVKIDPCEQTTGRSPLGAHLILASDEAQLNIHLGPASEVSDVLGQVSVGDQLEVEAFRTERLPEDHFIAVSLKIGEEEVVLRDEALRPRWARGAGPRARQQEARNSGQDLVSRGSQLVDSRLLGDNTAVQLTDNQLKEVQAILADAEKRIRAVLTEQQSATLNGQPRRGGRIRQGLR
jgi:hypothetical protein